MEWDQTRYLSKFLGLNAAMASSNTGPNADWAFTLRRINVCWFVSNGWRAMGSVAVIGGSCTLSVLATPWLGIPVGAVGMPLVLACSGPVERLIVRAMVRAVPPLAAVESESLAAATEALARRHWGIDEISQRYLMSRRMMDAWLVFMYVMSQAGVVRALMTR